MSNIITTDQRNAPASLEEVRARRVENLRKITGLSRQAFQNRYGISASTLQNWEDVKLNGLTEKGAKKLATALRSDEIYCTVEWLMYGTGQPPQFPPHLQPQSNYSIKQTNSVSEETLMAEELALFRQHHANTMEFIVIDDGMEPVFSMGEQVAGVRRNDNAIASVIERICIVQTAAGEILLRQIKKGGAEGFYNLVCINPHTTVNKPILYDVTLLTAAPVIWARLKE